LVTYVDCEPVDRTPIESETPECEPEQVRFASAVVLSKREAFGACQACADAERELLRSGRAAEAAGVAALFELIEGRLVSY
jgi:hypothetical protein